MESSCFFWTKMSVMENKLLLPPPLGNKFPGMLINDDKMLKIYRYIFNEEMINALSLISVLVFGPLKMHDIKMLKKNMCVCVRVNSSIVKRYIHS